MSNQRKFDFTKDTESINFLFNFSAVTIVECIIFGIAIYGYTHSFIWLVASLIISFLLYQVPFLKGILATMFSFLGAACIHSLFKPIYPATTVYLISIWSFIVFNTAHRFVGGISNIDEYGYSMSIAEILLISMFLHYHYHSIILSVIIFIVLILLIFVPIINIFELIILTFVASFAYFDLAREKLSVKHAITYSIIIFIYFGIYYAFVCRRILNHKASRKMTERMTNAYAEFELLKEKIYNKYPDLEKYYYYFKMNVCQSDKEREDFKLDWKKYIYYLDQTSTYCTFNEFFELKGLYKSSNYNHEYTDKWKQEQTQKEKQQNATEGDNMSNVNTIVYFSGIKDKTSLKKRYHDLLKIYHPDNQNGDTETVQRIQEEYECLENILK